MQDTKKFSAKKSVSFPFFRCVGPSTPPMQYKFRTLPLLQFVDAAFYSFALEGVNSGKAAYFIPPYLGT